MTRFAPITPDALVDLLAERIRAVPGHAVVGIDGADATDPIELAQTVGERVRAEGRHCETVSLHDYVRPASLRLEFGRTDELSYRTAWFDYEALRREVIEALRDDSRWLPALWDEKADRSARAAVRPAYACTVLIVVGPMLLGRNLNFDLTLRLHLSPNALQRGTDHTESWTIAALQHYESENIEEPDLLVRWDHPDRPAIRV